MGLASFQRLRQQQQTAQKIEAIRTMTRQELRDFAVEEIGPGRHSEGLLKIQKTETLRAALRHELEMRGR